MANQVWIGNAAPISQQTTLTPGGTIAANDTFSVTCNGKTLTYESVPGTVADICNGIANLIANASASVYPEFKEFQANNAGTTVVLNGVTPGLPFTVTLTTTSGSGTWTQSTGVAATGPNDWANGTNWSTGSAPASSGDTVFFNTGSVPVLYNLAQSANTLTALNISQAYTGTIGLPTYNAKGYHEYRTLELQIGATVINAGTGTTGSGSGRIKINVGSVACTLNVFNTGQPLDVGNPAFIWHGTNAGNVVNINKGTVGIAFFPGDTAVLTTLRTGYVSNVNSDVNLYCGSGCTLTTVTMDGGTVELNSGATTISSNAGILTVEGSGGATTLNVSTSTSSTGNATNAATCYWNSTGTIATANVWGTLDFSQDQQVKTLTNPIQAYANAVINDPFKVVTGGGGMAVKVNGTANSVTLNVGSNLTLTRS